MRRKIYSYLYLVILFSVHQSHAARVADTLMVKQGFLAGSISTDGRTRIYKGIPYASPPLGILRWKEPQPAQHWKGVRLALEYGNSAMQLTAARNPWTPEFINDQPVAEDCLYLNIWAPKHHKGKKYAVLVYIHGGGYVEGSGSTSIADGENLAKKGIIVVSINYRLGIFGFFTHPELTAESQHHASGNYGLMDQLAALKWIRENISAFGGDSKRVTVCGQSAGAGCVHNLIASPLCKGLISAGIAQSGSDLIPRTPMLNLSQAEKTCQDFFASAGIYSLQQLRALPATELLSYTKKLPGILRPVADGWFLPESVSEIYRQGKQNRVPVLTGINADEGSAKSSYGKLHAQDFQQQSQLSYKAFYFAFNRLYPSETITQAAKAQIESARDFGLASTWLWAISYSKTAQIPVYTYYFSHPIPWPEFPQYGAFHSSEIPYVFHNLDRLNRPWTTEDKRLSEMMSAYWVNFVNTGNPNGAKLPRWPKINPGKNQTLYIDTLIRSKEALSENKMHFFENFFYSLLKRR